MVPGSGRSRQNGLKDISPAAIFYFWQVSSLAVITMRVLVVGAGAQGGPCTSILAKDDGVSEIVLADVNLELAKKVAAKVGTHKVVTRKLDAASVDDVSLAAKGVDVIINLTLPAYDMNIMEAALRSGAHYVDTSFGEPSLLDIRARDNILAQIIENRPLSLDKEFKDVGLTALLGCGISPGMVNVITKYACDKFDHVNRIRIRLGDRPLKQPDVVSAWTPTWSPFRALWGYAVEPTIFENGEYKRYPIFSGPEEYHFPDPVGSILLTYHQHQEPITLPHFIDKGVQYCDFKYPVDTLAGAFVKMGFASPDPVEVNGIKVVPRNLLLKLVQPPVNAFLTEDESSTRLPPREAYVTVVEVEGSQSGEEIQCTISTPWPSLTTPEERSKVYDKLGTNMIDVALPAVVGAKLCVRGDADKGVICAECLDARVFLEMVAGMDAPVKLHEVMRKEISFSGLEDKQPNHDQTA